MGKEVHAPREQIIRESIEVILDLDFTCKKVDGEMLCDDCPFDLDYECGLHLLREQAKKIEKDLGIIGICPDCGSPATHPSGICRDCHQAKLERDEI